jgi:hypothetical protein
MSSSILVRALSPSGDMQWGNGQGNFISDADAVAQIIGTRLKLFQGEWFANQLEGLPLWQSILTGQLDADAAALLIQQVILGTPFVISVQQIQATYSPNSRQFSYAAIVQTQFGTFQLTGNPAVGSQSLP